MSDYCEQLYSALFPFFLCLLNFVWTNFSVAIYSEKCVILEEDIFSLEADGALEDEARGVKVILK